MCTLKRLQLFQPDKKAQYLKSHHASPLTRGFSMCFWSSVFKSWSCWFLVSFPAAAMLERSEEVKVGCCTPLGGGTGPVSPQSGRGAGPIPRLIGRSRLTWPRVLASYWRTQPGPASDWLTHFVPCDQAPRCRGGVTQNLSCHCHNLTQLTCNGSGLNNDVIHVETGPQICRPALDSVGYILRILSETRYQGRLGQCLRYREAAPPCSPHPAQLGTCRGVTVYCSVQLSWPHRHCLPLRLVPLGYI